MAQETAQRHDARWRGQASDAMSPCSSYLKTRRCPVMLGGIDEGLAIQTKSCAAGPLLLPGPELGHHASPAGRVPVSFGPVTASQIHPPCPVSRKHAAGEVRR